MEILETLTTWFQLIIAIFTPYVVEDVKAAWAMLNDYAILRAVVLMFLGYLLAKFLSACFKSPERYHLSSRPSIRLIIAI